MLVSIHGEYSSFTELFVPPQRPRYYLRRHHRPIARRKRAPSSDGSRHHHHHHNGTIRGLSVHLSSTQHIRRQPPVSQIDQTREPRQCHHHTIDELTVNVSWLATQPPGNPPDNQDSCTVSRVAAKFLLKVHRQLAAPVYQGYHKRRPQLETRRLPNSSSHPFVRREPA